MRILLNASFLNSIKNLDISRVYTQDLDLFPVYTLEDDVKFNLYYLQSIEPKSMSDKWELLTNEQLAILKDGRYLCKIIPTHDMANKFLIENYFILVKNNGTTI